ncbi:MAG: hypothetical protein GY862_25310 [Gammaproteobacteria bacterium]|nr:hypothetical protein [Gammaproteobacteria bacterium]
MPYTTIAVYTDPSLDVSQDDIDGAYQWVLSVLRSKGIDPDDVPAPNSTLFELEQARALMRAATRLTAGENSPLGEKAREYRTQAKELADLISAKSLGLTTTAGWWGTVEVERA